MGSKNEINDFSRGVLFGIIVVFIIGAILLSLGNVIDKRQEIKDEASNYCQSRLVDKISCRNVDVSNTSNYSVYEKRCYFTCYDSYIIKD